MLRLGLIENLQRVTTRLTIAREDRDLADLWVDRLQDMAEKNPSHLVVVVADMAKSDLPMSSSFVAEFCQRLSRQSPVLHLARSWLEQRLVEQGLSIEQLVHLESQNQAADQVSVSHSIASLRFLSAMDWKEFVETLSLVEETLRSDPADVYGEMDFATRDRYRHAVESLARHSQLSEAEVAQRAIQLAADSARQKGRDGPDRPCGLLSDRQGPVRAGARGERAVALANDHRTRHPPFSADVLCGRYRRCSRCSPRSGSCSRPRRSKCTGWKLIFFTLVFLLCASQLAVALMNWLSTLLVKPRLLPRLDYSSGIAADCRTMVVVPTMLTSLEGVDRLIETLEIHHLANRDQHLHFALLTDFRDAPEEILPGDRRVASAGAGRSRDAEPQISAPTDKTSSSCFTARAAGTPAKACGWVTNASGESSWSSTPCCAAVAADCFSEIVGETAILPADQVCHHARHRHPAAARCRPAARRHDGPSVEPSGVRCRARDCRRRLQHSATARRREPAERPAILVRPALCRRRGHRSLHAGGVRRVSGCLPGRLVHRQRDLRCGCLPASHERTLPGEHRSQPRLVGSVSCPLRPRERRGILRRISFPLQRGH